MKLWTVECQGSPVRGVFRARVLEWVAISFSGDLPDPGIEPGSPASQAVSLPSEPPGNMRKCFNDQGNANQNHMQYYLMYVRTTIIKKTRNNK